ncbi:MAG: AAA family ATPase [Acidobacteria bacterium]|nr:AAA family ATPase [Acidobacteriota bacterium]
MMARSLLTRWDEMADKTMPEERNGRPDTDAPAAAGASGDASVARTSDSAVAASQDGNERVDVSAPPLAKAAAPLITAVEIENFKGIGRPMRVEFRPITLLFGNNSAGKSTVLHALCYAHEILSHRNVDVHETDIGGDRIDLGGFRNLVHAHDPARPVRLRFDLNLEDWRIPQGLDEKLASPLDVRSGNADGSMFQGSERPSSGWIELQAKLTDDEQPVLSSYEIGVNDARVGRLLPRQPTGVSLEFDPTHPLLERSLRPRSLRRRTA